VVWRSGKLADVRWTIADQVKYWEPLRRFHPETENLPDRTIVSCVCARLTALNSPTSAAFGVPKRPEALTQLVETARFRSFTGRSRVRFYQNHPSRRKIFRYADTHRNRVSPRSGTDWQTQPLHHRPQFGVNEAAIDASAHRQLCRVPIIMWKQHPVHVVLDYG